MNALPWIVAAVSVGACVVMALMLRARSDGEALEITVSEPSRSDFLGAGSSALDILEQMDEGVVVLNDALNLRFANPVARRSIGMEPRGLPTRLPINELNGLARAAQRAGTPQEQVIEVFYPKRVLIKALASALSEGGVVVLLRDISEEARVQALRTEFVAHASHELRSPVAGLRASAEAVGAALEGDDPEAARRFADGLIGQIDRLARLVDDLLDLSRLEGAAAVPVEPCNVADVARDVAAAMADPVDEAEVELAIEIGSPLMVAGDAPQLSLMIRNLIDNAVRYTPEGEHVWLAARQTGAEVIISVRDDGMGIPHEAQSRIFERFYRVDKARTRDSGGTGLGLAIVKHVAELHRGTVEVASELGEGSTFTIRLPAFAAPTPSEPLPTTAPGTTAPGTTGTGSAGAAPAGTGSAGAGTGSAGAGSTSTKESV